MAVDSPSTSAAPRIPLGVLLLEDQITLRAPLRRYLEASGFEVVEADSVDEAFAQLRRAMIACAILDVRMPNNRSGLEVLQFIRLNEYWHDMPVIILTGAHLTEEEEEIIRRHRAYVFYKPHGYIEIVERLNKMLRHT
ncbi:MAG: response regulator [Acidimicrobiia bacterium]